MHEAQAYHVIGLDVHKQSVVFCEKTVTGQTVGQGRIPARRQELTAFAQSRARPWVGGLEATLFSGWIYDVLEPYAVDLLVGHPLRLKALTKNKNDRIDAEMLANLLRAELFPRCHMASPKIRELRRVLRHRNFLVRQATRMKNKASGILLEVGAQYTKHKLHGKKYFSELVEGLEDVPESVRELLRMTRANLEMFTNAQRLLLDALTRHAVLRERVELLKTVGGVGDVTALTWALEIDTPYRFPSVKDVQSYCGLCSAEHESAGKSWRMPLSKERNPHLQSILIEAAKLAPLRCPHLRAVHDKVLNKPGGNRNRATLEVARKLAAYLLAVDKSGNAFVTPEC
jgi:transposase